MSVTLGLDITFELFSFIYPLFCRILRPGESAVTVFDVITEFFEDLWEDWFTSRTTYLRIFKKRSLRNLISKFRRKREVVLPSLGVAGEIVNDLANTAINTATVLKYQ